MTTEKQKGWYWPWLLATGLLATVTVNTVMLFAANSDRNGVAVEPDYYKKAVAWDSTLALQLESNALGWRSDATLSRDDRPAASIATAGTVTVTLVDRAGEPLSGVNVAATLIHNTAPNDRVTIPLKESAPGVYTAFSRLSHLGRWELRLLASRGSDRFASILHPELVAGAR
ncbi:MAG: FixH family protein [Gemmatimonadaceae bacterium]